MKIFLAGATGLVGTSIINYVLNNAPTLQIIGTYKSTKPFIHNERIKYIQADLTRRTEYEKAAQECECAIMAAANTGGALSATSVPYRQVTDNIVMDATMLETFYFSKIKRVIYISSATVYQEMEGYIREDDLDLNQDPHPSYYGIGWVKRSAEKLCQFWHTKYGIDIIIVRLSNIFGPYASFDPKRSNFIPAIIRKAVEKMDPFEVWGSPDVTRDVIYSDDFARVVIMLLLNTNIKFNILNIGSGIKTTVDDVVKWSLQYAEHRPSEIRYIQDKPTTIKFRALDCTKIKNVLGWEPQYTIEEGIKKTTEWWFKNKGWWGK
jgi:GDP-L-fucose synthase